MNKKQKASLNMAIHALKHIQKEITGNMNYCDAFHIDDKLKTYRKSFDRNVMAIEHLEKTRDEPSSICAFWHYRGQDE